MSASEEIFQEVIEREFKDLDGLQLKFVKDLGAGGQGRVFQVQKVSGQSQKIKVANFALKVFQGERAKDVKKEIEKSLSVEHQHFVKIFSGESRRKISIIAMELARESLEDRLQEGV